MESVSSGAAHLGAPPDAAQKMHWVAAAYADTPSARAGVDALTEHQHRVFGCELIQEACILMKLPQVIAATGQNILHRFYHR
jgi:hypothetical protein